MSSDDQVIASSRYLLPSDLSPQHAMKLPWQRAALFWLDGLSNPKTRRVYSDALASLFTDMPVGTQRRGRRAGGVKPPVHEQPTRAGMPACLDDVTPERLRAWRGTLIARMEQGAIAPATANQFLSAIRSFFLYHLRVAARPELCHVQMTKEALYAALESVRVDSQRPYAVLDAEGSAALLQSAHITGKSQRVGGENRVARASWQRLYSASRDIHLAERDQTILVLALATGLRCAEIAALQVSDLTERAVTVPVLSDDGRQILNERGKPQTRQQLVTWVHVRQGKGNKQRQVPLSAEDARTILAYLASTDRNLSRAEDRKMPLFLSRNRTGLSSTQIRRIIDSIADTATAREGLSASATISPHSLRHTYAINLLKGDPEHGRRPATIAEVQRLLGHSDIRTTQRYVQHLQDDELALLAPVVSDSKS